MNLSTMYENIAKCDHSIEVVKECGKHLLDNYGNNEGVFFEFIARVVVCYDMMKKTVETVGSTETLDLCGIEEKNEFINLFKAFLEKAEKDRLEINGMIETFKKRLT